MMAHCTHRGLGARRDFLRVGGVTLAAASWELFNTPPPAFAGTRASRSATADSVVFLWLPGGVTHHESFDPKPDAASGIRTEVGLIGTSVPGVQFTEVLPQLARHMDKLALVRSFAAGTEDHFLGQALALSGRNALTGGILSEPNFGSFIWQQKGATGGLPGYLAVPGTTEPGPPNTNLFTAAWLGQKYAPFATRGEPRSPDFRVEDLALVEGLTNDRLARRQTLRQIVEGRLRTAERHKALDDLQQLYGRAVGLITSPQVRKAFDVHAEPTTAKEKYGLTKIGQRCLLARRLLEADARFVMVDYGYDWGEYNNLWDNHCAPVQNQPVIHKMVKEPYHLPAVDQAFAALIDDLHRSGRLERTLVVYLTEFGRTPKINSNGGRDHWAHAGSIFYVGGGVRGGQVIGSTDRDGAYCTSRTYSPAEAVATVYRAIGVEPDTLVTNRDGRTAPIQPTGEPIPVF